MSKELKNEGVRLHCEAAETTRCLVKQLLSKPFAGLKAPLQYPHPPETYSIYGNLIPLSFLFQSVRKGRALAIGSAETQNLKNTIYLLTVQKAPFNLCFL